MKTAATTLKCSHDFMDTLSKHPLILAKITDIQVIWHPEWRHFKIAKLCDTYLLLEADKLIFHSDLLETVRMELIERFHFYIRNNSYPDTKTNQLLTIKNKPHE